MAAPSRSSASWERVLAALEADAARAAALLTSDDAHAAAGIAYDEPGAIQPSPEPAQVPATWRLPAAAGAAPAAGAAARRAVAGYAANRPAFVTAESAHTGEAAAPAVADPAAPHEATTEIEGVATGAGLHLVDDPAAPPAHSADGTSALSILEPAPGSAQIADASAVPRVETASETTDFELPDAADMPPMTPEQAERLEALRHRIETLKAELSTAMTQAEEMLARPAIRRLETQPRPELVDRRL